MLEGRREGRWSSQSFNGFSCHQLLDLHLHDQTDITKRKGTQ